MDDSTRWANAHDAVAILERVLPVYDAAMAMYRHKHPIIHRPMSDGDDEAYQLIMQYFRACNKAEEVERG